MKMKYSCSMGLPQQLLYFQRMRSNPNKQNIREGILNAGKKSIKLKHCDKRCLGQLFNNETGFFNHPSSELETEKEGQQKLIQLTAQCAQYFERFTAEKDTHLQVINRAFSEVTQKVDLAFGKIIQEAQRKLNQIRVFLTKEHDRLRDQKRIQEEQLNILLVQIKSVHLTKLESSDSFDLKEALSEYAGTLDTFFNVMMEIESNDYEDSVEECMNFINNLVKQELKNIVQGKFSPKIEDIIGTNFLCSDECFTFDEDGIIVNEETVSLMEQTERPNKENNNLANIFQEIETIRNSQTVREGRINHYHSLLISNNPFKGVKLLIDSKKQQI